MALRKALALQHMTKWIVIGIVAILLIAIFFWQFGQFFIPLVLAGLVGFGLSMQSAQTKKPISPTLTVVLTLGTFMFGYFIQRFSTVALSGADISTDPTTAIIDQTMTIMLLIFVLALVLMFMLSRKAAVRRRR